MANFRICNKGMEQTIEETSLLIRQVQAGDRLAFHAFIKKYQRLVAAIVFRMVYNAARSGGSMNNTHFSDEQIQKILDNMAFQSSQSPAPHLQTCASCRKRLEQYRQLYAGLAADPGFVLPPTFADSIIKKLPVSRPVFGARPIVRIFLTISACALVLAGLLFFVNMKPLANDAIRIFNTMVAAFRPLTIQFQQLLAEGNARLFVLGGLGLLSAAFFDHILQQQTLRRNR